MADPSPSTSSSSPAAPPAKEIKKANKPFLVQKRYKEKQAAAEAERAKNGGSSKAAPPAPSFVANALKWTALALLTSAAMSRALTNSWTFGYEGKWSNPKQIYSLLFHPKPLVLSEQQLSFHDGRNPAYPLYIAIDGDVFDVSDGGMRSYGPGGAYHVFAGKDAARAYVTGCFETHLTHDLRGFTEKDMATLDNWKKFYGSHAKYHKVGTVVHAPIDPSSPVPEPCNQGKSQPAGKEAKKAQDGHHPHDQNGRRPAHPRILLRIPRAALLANSLVFRHMLEDAMPGTSSDDGGADTIPLAEKEAELELFFEVLQGQHVERDLDKLTDEQWETLARVADKYDSPVARGVVQCQIWKDMAERVWSFRAFTLAIMINDLPLIRRTAKDALLLRRSENLECGAGEEWRNKLEDWVDMLMIHAAAQATTFKHNLQGCNDDEDGDLIDEYDPDHCTTDAAVRHWHDNLRLAAKTKKRHFNPLHPFTPAFLRFNPREGGWDNPLFKSMDEPGVCSHHRQELFERVEALEEEYLCTMPEFPA
ncbi:hypothetical protein JCM6882_002075 [Rhodosporidiobolus microsporus]